VPLIVSVPPKWARLAPRGYVAGGRGDRLVSFVDLAPTVLGLAGLEAPAWMQGRAFMGPQATPDPPYVFGFRGRMDERYDMVRSARDRRYVYVRNYMPHLPAGQHNAYMFETPSTRAWKKLFDEGKLPPAQARFWLPKSPEELYDLEKDPDEIDNLATSAAHREVLARMRGALREHLLAVRDVGFLPESAFHARSAGSSPYEMARDDQKYPLERILSMAEAASSLDPAALPALVTALRDDHDGAVRYWAAMGVLMRGRDAAAEHGDALRAALKDESACVRIAAAEALGCFGAEKDCAEALGVLVGLGDVSKHGPYVAMAALNAIDAAGPRAARVREAVARLPRSHDSVDKRMESGVSRLIEAIVGGAE
jgi:uncharacterized sulfatase